MTSSNKQTKQESDISIAFIFRITSLLIFIHPFTDVLIYAFFAQTSPDFTR